MEPGIRECAGQLGLDLGGVLSFPVRRRRRQLCSSMADSGRLTGIVEGKSYSSFLANVGD